MKKIAVVTGSRAEYGSLYCLMKDIENDVDLELQVVVTGTHLSDQFGSTDKQIMQDGFTIDARVFMQIASDDSVAIVKSMGVGLIGFADAFTYLKPDLLVVLGDRYEIFSAVQAALMMKIPVAHIHGGEITGGSLDDSIRHAITKLSHLHFVAAEEYKNRVLQLGEVPENVFNVGAPGLDQLERTTFLSKKTLKETLNISLSSDMRNFLITYHPVTTKLGETYDGLFPLLEALDHFPDANLIFTGSNADEGGQKINQLLSAYLKKRDKQGSMFMSLGSKRYLSLLKNVDLVMGNSSSALIEAPALGVPSIDIGERQAGRLRASSVLHCDEHTSDIVATINKALTPQFQSSLSNIRKPYGASGASKKIVSILKAKDPKSLIKKQFHDYEKNIHYC